MDTAQEVFDFITEHLLDNGVVVIGTALRAWQFDKPKHAELFRVRAGNCEMRQGKGWVPLTIAGRPCIGIRRARYVNA